PAHAEEPSRVRSLPDAREDAVEDKTARGVVDQRVRRLGQRALARGDTASATIPQPRHDDAALALRQVPQERGKALAPRRSRAGQTGGTDERGQGRPLAHAIDVAAGRATDRA